MAGNEKRIVVFGGAGFIGRHLVRRFARDGWIVRVATRHPAAALFLKPLGDVGQVVPLRADICQPASAAAAMAGVDAVVNLVGILYERGRRTFQAVHADAPGLLGRLATQAGVRRVVHISAIGAAPESASAYARSKAAGEAALREAFPAATILRPSIVFGPEDQFFNRFAAQARISPVLPLIGGGATRFQPVYVGDVADAIFRTVRGPDAAGRIFELGGPRIYTFRALLEYLLAVTGRRRLLVDLPFGLADALAAVLQLLPAPPLTRDQVRLLRQDNVVGAGVPGLSALGLSPTPLEAIVPTYLAPARRHPDPVM